MCTVLSFPSFLPLYFLPFCIYNWINIYVYMLSSTIYNIRKYIITHVLFLELNNNILFVILFYFIILIQWILYYLEITVLQRKSYFSVLLLFLQVYANSIERMCPSLFKPCNHLSDLLSLFSSHAKWWWII